MGLSSRCHSHNVINKGRRYDTCLSMVLFMALLETDCYASIPTDGNVQVEVFHSLQWSLQHRRASSILMLSPVIVRRRYQSGRGRRTALPQPAPRATMSVGTLEYLQRPEVGTSLKAGPLAQWEHKHILKHYNKRIQSAKALTDTRRRPKISLQCVSPSLHALLSPVHIHHHARHRRQREARRRATQADQEPTSPLLVERAFQKKYAMHIAAAKSILQEMNAYRGTLDARLEALHETSVDSVGMDSACEPAVAAQAHQKRVRALVQREKRRAKSLREMQDVERRQRRVVAPEEARKRRRRRRHAAAQQKRPVARPKPKWNGNMILHPAKPHTRTTNIATTSPIAMQSKQCRRRRRRHGHPPSVAWTKQIDGTVELPSLDELPGVVGKRGKVTPTCPRRRRGHAELRDLFGRLHIPGDAARAGANVQRGKQTHRS